MTRVKFIFEMSYPLEEFKSILEKHATKTHLGIYSTDKYLTKQSYKPKDVLKNVLTQLKAIQVADTIKHVNSVNKDLLRYKKSGLLPINKLPMYEIPKQSTFDTQFVSNTQLINIVNDAEIMNEHRGMTQEFEITFDFSEKSSKNKSVNIKLSHANIKTKEINKETHNRKEGVNFEDANCEYINECFNTNVIEDMTDKDKGYDHVLNRDINNINYEKFKEDSHGCDKYSYYSITTEDMKIDKDGEDYAEKEEYSPSVSQIQNEDLSLDVATKTHRQRSQSPVFIDKKVKSICKSPSPLVFNLEMFERFENVAISVVQNNNFDKAKHVFNSQILGRQLHINIDANVELEAKLSPILGDTPIHYSQDISQNVSNEIVCDKDKSKCFKEVEFRDDLSELDNTTYLHESLCQSTSIKSQDLDQIKSQILPVKVKKKQSSEIIKDNLNSIVESVTKKPSFNLIEDKVNNDSANSLLSDEILFSSDEEEYVNKEFQELPFTCVLETSSYNQSDVLEKTMYVGFQTASNKSIQICKESFNKAKNILSAVVDDDTSIAELVNICDKCNKVTNSIEENKIQSNTGKQSLDDNNIETDVKSKMCSEIKQFIENNATPIPKWSPIIDNSNDMVKAIYTHESRNSQKRPGNINKKFDGFKTSSNKKIKLSDKALARCQKVFQGIDIYEQYNTSGYLNITDAEIKSKIGEENFNDIDSKDIDKFDDVIETNIKDDLLIQEFENIEMSLAVVKEVNECTEFVRFKTASNKNIVISDTAMEKTKSIFKDIDEVMDGLTKVIHNDFNCTKNEGLQPDNEVMFTIANIETSNIEISDRTSNKTENIIHDVENIDEVKEMCQFNNTDILEEGENNNKKKFTTKMFTGFKTANNKIIKISQEALVKSKNLFNNIDSTEVKPTTKTVYPNLKIINQPSTSKVFLSDSKSGNNKEMSVFIDNLESIKTTAKGFNSPDVQDIQFAKEIASHDDMNKKPYFVGFKTGNNKEIKFSHSALVKSKKIFSDLDSTEFPNKISTRSIKQHDESSAWMPRNNAFIGFKTANNKEIKISNESLVKTKCIFKDLESTDFYYPQLSKNNSIKITDDLNKNDCRFTESSEIIKDTLLTSNDKIVGDKGVLCFEKRPDVNVGFKTASNKQVLISKEAMIKTNGIFMDINIDDTINKVTEKQPYSNRQPKTFNSKTKNDEEIKDILSKDLVVFRGFQTASKNVINVSKAALAYTKKIFQGINSIHNTTDINNFHHKLDDSTKPYPSLCVPTVNTDFKDFQLANNKILNISENALTESRKIFEEPDSSFKALHTASSNTVENSVAKHEENINNIINTQVLDNFELNLYTEDFQTSPIKSKRVGSPILSCPRAKRRKKFKPPYSQTEFQTPIFEHKTVRENSKIDFDENYKKNKVFKLQDLVKYLNKDINIDAYLSKFTFDNLLEFEFEGIRNELTSSKMTIDSLKQMFLNNVKQSLVPEGWIDNHLRLILWKLISYEVKFSKLTVVCTSKNVLNQLKYRYDRELYNAERPVLRKILEKDDVASKTIVLCVVAIYEDGVKVNSVTNLLSTIELLVTDGWYCIKATIDKMLAKLVYDQKIVVGTKFVTNGAELLNCEQGVAPWEDTSSVRLKLFGNSTKRARWSARLGRHGDVAILSRLSTVALNGGKVSRLRLYVTRLYPPLYIEKLEDRSTVTRSERLEHLYQMKYETERQTMMERVYEEVEKEFYDRDSQDSEGSDAGGKGNCLGSGTQIAKMMKKSMDPVEFRASAFKRASELQPNQLGDVFSSVVMSVDAQRIYKQILFIFILFLQAHLTSSQTTLLVDHMTKRREKLLQDVQDRIQEEMEKNGLTEARNVVPVMKIRVVGIEEENGAVQVTKGMLSIWKPNEDILEIIKEGVWIDVMNVVPTGFRYSEIQISAGRQSIFSISKYKQPEIFKPYINLLKRKCYTLKEIAPNPTMLTEYNEIDTVGLIFLIEPSLEDFDIAKYTFQNVYITDSDKNMICINFWGGLNKFGCQNVLDTGQIVFCGNLLRRVGNNKKNILQYRATEFTQFTKTPKNENARIMLQALNKTFMGLDRRKFCDDCVSVKNNYAVIKSFNDKNISPYRPSDESISINKAVDTHLGNKEDIFNLSGLDFESTFKQADTQDSSAEMLLRKKCINEKITKLKMYGEPPPLSPMLIINKSKNACQSYKSPLLNDSKLNTSLNKNQNTSNGQLCSKSDSLKITIVQNTLQKNENINIVTSPVLNRTYSIDVKPVRLNFNDENVVGEVDHFAEEFDGSPPLSLD